MRHIIYNFITQARKIRHSRLLENQEWLWRFVRPLYEASLNLLSFGSIEVCLITGDKIKLDAHMNQWGDYRGFEPDSCKAVALLLKDDSIFFDVGAHVGIYTCLAGKRIDLHKGKIVAFEPSPSNFKLLRKHTRANIIGNIVLENKLVGDTVNPSKQFHWVKKEFTGNSLAYKAKGAVETYIEMTTLDHYCRQQNIWPSLVKIDVEGFEYRVLLGMKSILQKIRPIIFLSLHPQFLPLIGDSVEQIQSYLSDLKYKISGMNGEEKRVLGFEEVLLFPFK